MSSSTQRSTLEPVRYDVVYTAAGSEALAALGPGEQTRVRDKLDRIASSEFREPRDWDFQRMDGRAEGRFSIGGGLRVFADIDDVGGVIRVHHIGRRENLYA